MLEAVDQKKGDIDSVNHLGITVRNLNRARALYERLGFTLTPLSSHSGSTKPGQAVQALATANHCAVFPRNYVEILGLANPQNDNPVFGWTGFLDRFAGAQIVCFGCQDTARVADRLDASQIGNSGVVVLQRDVDTPQGTRTAIFDRVLIDGSLTPEGRRIQAAHHRFPEYVHQERYMTHANGATSLAALLFVSNDPAETAARYASFTGQSVKATGDLLEIRLPLVTTLQFTTPEKAAQRLPGSLLPPAPCIAAATFTVTSLADAKAHVGAAGFPVIESANGFHVPAEDALGVVHEFVQAED